MVSLPPEVSAQVFREFPPERIHELSLEISKLPNISPEVRAQVIEEFFQSTSTGDTAGRPATTFAGTYAEERGAPAPSPGEAEASRSRPLDFLRRVDPHHLLGLIRREHPQTIALVLSQLQPSQASAVLAELPAALQGDVANRLADMGKVDLEVLAEVEQVLERRLFALMEGEFSPSDGREALVEILSQSDRDTEERIMSGLSQRSPHLATEMKEKLCEFEDLLHVDDASLHQVLRLTDIRDLVLALKGAPQELAGRVYGCMSPEAARALKKDGEALGQVNYEEVRMAQQQIRNILRGLVQLGKIRFR